MGLRRRQLVARGRVAGGVVLARLPAHLPTTRMVRLGRLRAAGGRLGRAGRSQHASARPAVPFRPDLALQLPADGGGAGAFYWVLGTGRVGYLVGVSAFALANLAAYVWVIRGPGAPERRPEPVLRPGRLGRPDLPRLLLQPRLRPDRLRRDAARVRPDAAYRSAQDPGLALGLRGSLPLLHPALVPASALWLAVEVVLGLPGTARPPTRRLGDGSPARSCSRRPGCWPPAGTAARGLEQPVPPPPPVPLRPDGRRLTGGSGLRGGLRTPFSIPTLTTTLLIAVAALGLVVTALTGYRRRVPIRVLIPAVLIAGVVAVNLLRGFAYWGFYLLGLGPCLLFAFGGSPRPRRIALAVLIVLAAAHSAVDLRLDRSTTARLAGQREAVAFLVGQSTPGETIVVGPPFLMASAPRTLPGGRRVLRVVPQPFYLLDFDRDRYRADITAHGDVHWRPQWFTRTTIGGGLGRESTPLFEGAEVRQARFFGEPVLVARRVNGPSEEKVSGTIHKGP